MRRFFRTGFLSVLVLMLLTPYALIPEASAQNLADFFNLGNKPVEYDQPRQIGRGYKRPLSIDQCLEFKQYSFNETHNIWVDGLVRCLINEKGVLSTAQAGTGISNDPAEEDKCKNRRDGQIIQHGVPSEEAARKWSEQCAYLGTVGGAGPITSSTNTDFDRYFGTTSQTRVGSGNKPEVSSNTSTSTSTGTTSGTSTATGTQGPVYKGLGIQVPDKEKVAGGISKEESLIDLIIFYTNATLPYVSVISIFVFVAAGLYYILSFTNEELHNKAKQMMMYVVIGIVIIFSAYTVVNTLLRIAGAS